MTAPTCTIPGCTRPVPDMAYACPGCATQYDQDLAATPGLLDDLEVSAARLSRTGTRAGRSTGGSALPVDLHAAGLHAELANTVTTWARHVAEERGMPGLTGTPAAAAEWLRGNLEWIRHRPESAEMIDQVADLVRRARRTIDLPPDRWYAGPCHQCGQDLSARPGAADVTCRPCDLVWPAAERRQWLLDAARDTMATAALISQALSILDAPITASMVRNYAARGRIVSGGVDRQGRPLYRVGDVLDALARRRQRAASGAA